MSARKSGFILATLVSSLALPLIATGAAPEAAAPVAGPRASDSFTLQPVLVTAEKREEDLQNVPASVTVVSGQTIEDAGITTVDQAGRYVPNLTFSQFTAQRLSFPFIRGIGSGRNNPAVKECIDGVPPLSF